MYKIVNCHILYVSSKTVVFSYSDMPQSPCSCGSSKKRTDIAMTNKKYPNQAHLTPLKAVKDYDSYYRNF